MTEDLESGQEVEVVTEIDAATQEVDTDIDNLEAPQDPPEPAIDLGDESTAEPTGGETPQEPPRRNRAQERIDELTADKYQLKGRLDATQQRLAELEGQATPSAPPPEPETLAAPPAPTLAEFDGDYEAFTAAQTEWQASLADYTRKQVLADIEAANTRTATQNAEQEAASSLEQSWNEQVAAASTKYSDFSVVAQDEYLPVTEVMGRTIQQLDNGADVLYWLGKNPERAARISQMPPEQQQLQVARLSGTIMSDSKGQAPAGGKKVSAAPKPPSTVKGQTSSPEKNPDKMSQSEYNEWRNSGGGK